MDKVYYICIASCSTELKKETESGMVYPGSFELFDNIDELKGFLKKLHYSNESRIEKVLKSLKIADYKKIVKTKMSYNTYCCNISIYKTNSNNIEIRREEWNKI